MHENYPGFKYEDWRDVLDKYINQTKKQQLFSIDKINISSEDMAVIKEIKNRKLEKLYFTLLCIAKFKNMKSECNNNWVSETETEIFNTANVFSKNSADRASMLHKLYLMGLISYATRVDNLNIRVEKISDEKDVEISITDMRDIGYQYDYYCGESYTKCLECNRFVRQSRNGRVKYCKECAKTVNRRLSIVRYKNKIFKDEFQHF